MSIKSKTYILPPTPLIPNSPYPLIHYPGLLSDLVSNPLTSTTTLFDLFHSNGWQSQWIARYGPDIQSHYHSTTHEAMAVISGYSATIRFGVADAKDWQPAKLPAGARGQGESGGVEIQAHLGDVFVIPAGVSHKTFSPIPCPAAALAFHQPLDMQQGNAASHVDDASRMRHREFFAGVPVASEFMMMGAYPEGGVWDFMVGGEHGGGRGGLGGRGPGRDPVLGESVEGVRGLWGVKGLDEEV
ncbi:hypothetical protein GQ44DRAFT_730068 [Phaeosphaeriaceae sp. PMI808]|nr:hypothetical protein GQ44DRAFT_730068 [Phaeosphaeriaceae sp. PMI808]